MTAYQIVNLPAISTQAATDIYEVSANGTGSYKESRAQLLAYAKANSNPSITSVTTTNSTLALTDRNTCQVCTNASTQTITIPPNSSVAFSIGDTIDFIQYGAGQVVLAAGAGVTINSIVGSSPKTSAQYSIISARQIATNTWLVYGGLTA
jgi:hypothetical protein